MRLVHPSVSAANPQYPLDIYPIHNEHIPFQQVSTTSPKRGLEKEEDVGEAMGFTTCSNCRVRQDEAGL